MVKCYVIFDGRTDGLPMLQASSRRVKNVTFGYDISFNLSCQANIKGV
ncbi:hypothetical protein KsCSTR_19020 [Candidatus Kuenenia stuttgartiensis]|uniref:Uncharacterized protein n=1 Tax=Kuenenia stuttgartiensis TaxID=174633 RepID=A0A6G7GPB7_KUEST|nr:hypothetical protein KsCSTR_19020 [Candidatus Kuenenia stuttgartiensis]